jgi:hypothetical protein
LVFFFFLFFFFFVICIKASPLVLEHKTKRLVRVFLSSTFVDMHGEREVIMRKVMVELNQFCTERGVYLSYIDMRWGIMFLLSSPLLSSPLLLPYLLLHFYSPTHSNTAK